VAGSGTGVIAVIQTPFSTTLIRIELMPKRKKLISVSTSFVKGSSRGMKTGTASSEIETGFKTTPPDPLPYLYAAAVPPEPDGGILPVRPSPKVISPVSLLRTKF